MRKFITLVSIIGLASITLISHARLTYRLNFFNNSNDSIEVCKLSNLRPAQAVATSYAHPPILAINGRPIDRSATNPSQYCDPNSKKIMQTFETIGLDVTIKPNDLIESLIIPVKEQQFFKIINLMSALDSAIADPTLAGKPITIEVATMKIMTATEPGPMPTKVITVSEQLKDPALQAPVGYKYLSMTKDPNGLYNYIYYFPKPAALEQPKPTKPQAPAGQFIAKLTFDHKLTDPQKDSPYDGFNYLYFYPDKGSFVYVFVNDHLGRLLNHAGILAINDGLIDVELQKYEQSYGSPEGRFGILIQLWKDMKKYYGSKTIREAYLKLCEIHGEKPISFR